MTSARFLLSKGRVIEQYNAVKSACDTVSYSIKTNFDVGKILDKETDCLFTVHSPQSTREISNSSRIIFLAQGWDRPLAERLFAAGVNKFIVDNENDMNVLLPLLERKRAWVFVRIRMQEHTVQTGKYFVYGFRKPDAARMVSRLAGLAGVEKLGLHFHRKTQNTSEWGILEELQGMFGRATFDAVDMINIGGGLPVAYKNFSDSVMPSIWAKIARLRQWLAKNDIKLIIEPGRFIAAPPVVLEAKILNIYDSNIIVDCSVWNSAMDTFIQNIRLLVEHETEGTKTAYTIKGISPDSMDILRYRVYLPERRKGDIIRFLNAGAYNFHANFCNLPKLKTVILP